ncbi:MAG: tetratricopeptide repeat protein, partial [Leptolyngbya sp. SIO3F4]|nr:tetratricopeptide repeat protein [Leptolyngbya sp. SIO3F4]
PETKPAEPTTPEPIEINYAEKYARRARVYLNQRNYDLAIQELREGLKIDPSGIEFHSMLGQAYLMKRTYGSDGMARAHLKRVLELNPNHSVALKYIQILEKRVAEKRKADIQASQSSQPKPTQPKTPTQPKPTRPKSIPEKPWFKRILGR